MRTQPLPGCCAANFLYDVSEANLADIRKFRSAINGTKTHNHTLIATDKKTDSRVEGYLKEMGFTPIPVGTHNTLWADNVTQSEDDDDEDEYFEDDDE